jgi:uncharacterized membrane protein YqgA involved in biofilm formation
MDKAQIGKTRGLLVQLGCVTAGVIIGHFLGKQFAPILAPVLAIALALVGSGIGLTLAPISKRVVYPLAFLVIGSYFGSSPNRVGNFGQYL